MKLSKNRKAGLFLLTAVFVCILCSGCRKEEPKTEPETTKISETAATDAEKTAETVNADVQSPTIPTTIKESEELFGKTDKVTGKWIPPKDSYTDPKTGNIINREGVVIGIAPGYTPKPNPNAVG